MIICGCLSYLESDLDRQRLRAWFLFDFFFFSFWAFHMKSANIRAESSDFCSPLKIKDQDFWLYFSFLNTAMMVGSYMTKYLSSFISFLLVQCSRNKLLFISIGMETKPWRSWIFRMDSESLRFCHDNNFSVGLMLQFGLQRGTRFVFTVWHLAQVTKC